MYFTSSGSHDSHADIVGGGGGEGADSGLSEPEYCSIIVSQLDRLEYLENILSGSEPGLERTGVAETTCVSKWLKVTADQLLHRPARNMNMHRTRRTINVNWKFSFDLVFSSIEKYNVV